ncbi:Acetamidase 4 [Colletotrichum truncatum]|uniref:Acetamidase 4 n=1 Tax=Colletotrichum truncatum TaxID=5467 RepID=A0ACC3YU18_COLTU|nr:Acetamidase 4 [Colletotrichum truncatum]KAF6799359.1 Acetamidase 4 [Colletotrichum truncatum]
MPAAMGWEAIASRHKAKQQQAIPREWRLSEQELDLLSGKGTPQEGQLILLDAARKSALLTKKELEITEDYNTRQLLNNIHNGSLTSEDVTVAFCKRAALAQQLTNCLTEILFEEAILRAKALDQKLKETGSPVGPLHGLPISLKDSFIIKGHYATVGYVEFLKRPPPDSNSTLVDLLLDAGAILFCKTNVPQTMMTADSENNIFGRTLNPHKTTLTAGGSTGGEGALVAFRGSPLGVGTDIAGSVRIPSLCCGIYGFKPTANRMPFGRQAYSPFPKLQLPGVTPVAGPMANSVDDLWLFMKTILAQRPWKYDASAVDMPWNESKVALDRNLTIGVLPEDPDYRLHPPVRRALESAITALTEKGHKVIRLPADPAYSAGHGARLGYIYFGMISSGLDALASEIGEPLVTSVKRDVHPFTKAKPPVLPGTDLTHQLSEFFGLRDIYADNWRKVWTEYDLDVVIGPGAISTAVPHDTYGVPVYTLMWNVLDYPSGIIPYGPASKEKDPQYEKATSEFEADYDPEASDGVPCSIQVTAPSFNDEECLNAIRIIDSAIRR